MADNDLDFTNEAEEVTSFDELGIADASAVPGTDLDFSSEAEDFSGEAEPVEAPARPKRNITLEPPVDPRFPISADNFQEGMLKDHSWVGPKPEPGMPGATTFTVDGHNATASTPAKEAELNALNPLRDDRMPEQDDGSLMGDLEVSWYQLRQALAGNKLRGEQDDVALANSLENYAKMQGLPVHPGITQMRSRAQQGQEQAIQDIAGFGQKAAAIPESPAAARFNRSKTFTEAWNNFWADPLTVTRSTTARSAANSLPSVVGGIVGSVFGPMGAAGGAGAGSYTTEFGSAIAEQLQEHGADISDPESIKAVWASHKEEITKAAHARAMIIGGIDALTGGVTSKIANLPGAKTFTGKVANVAAKELTGTATQMAGGAGGETAAQLYEGGPLNPSAILGEAIGEAGGGAVETAGQIAVAGGKKMLAGEQTPPEVAPPRTEPTLSGPGKTSRQQTDETMRLLADAGITADDIRAMSPEQFNQTIKDLQEQGAMPEGPAPSQPEAPVAPLPGQAPLAPPRQKPASEAPTAQEGVSFIITKAQKEELGKRGYTPEQIHNMRPTEAHRILKTTADEPSAEPIADIKAQIEDMKDPNTERRGVFLSKDAWEHAKTAITGTKGALKIENFDGKGGVLIVPNEKVGNEAMKMRDAGTPMQEILGRMTGAGTGKPADGTVVIQQKNANGDVIRESLVTEADVPKTQAEFKAPGKTVETVTPEEAIARREKGVEGDGLDFTTEAEPATVGDGTRARPVQLTGDTAEIEQARSQVNATPTEAQQAAGDDKKGHIRVSGAGETSETAKGSRTQPIKIETPADLEAASAAASTDYTPAEGEANNRKLGHVEWKGLKGSIEVAAGGTRKGTDPKTGKAWETKHSVPYGYWKGTKGADDMHIDAYWGPEPEADHPVFVLNEFDDKADKFRQHKTFVGFPDERAVREAYLGTSSKKPSMIGGIIEMSPEEFKVWLEKPQTKQAGYIPKIAESSSTPKPAETKAEKAPRVTVPQAAARARADFASGKPLAMPNDITDLNAMKAYNKAWHAANAAKPVPGVTGPKAKPEWKEIGKNRDGHPLYEDERGVRSYVESGVRISEPVGVIPGRGISVTAEADKEADFQLAKDEPAPTSETPSINRPEKGSEAPEAEETPSVVEENRVREKHDPIVVAFRDRLLSPDGGFSNILQARKFATEHGFEKTELADSKDIEEKIELAVVLAAREIIASSKKANRSVEVTYKRLVDLYNRQPKLGTRTSKSMAEQAYSTPAPIAFIASRLAGVAEAKSVLEPTAGNGMLLIEALPSKATVNEMADIRADNLKAQGFRVSQEDASIGPLRHAGYPVDSVIMNPPFGAVMDETGRNKRFEVAEGDKVWVTPRVDYAIALIQMKAMAEDGKAVLILGGPAKQALNSEAQKAFYSAQAQREFYYRLYQTYKVTDHFTIHGDLYTRQGAGWPIDVVVIDGKGKSALDLPAVTPPSIYDSFDSLKEKLDGRDLKSPQSAEPSRRPPGGPADEQQGSQEGNAGPRADLGTQQSSELQPEAGQPSGIRDGRNTGKRGPARDNGPASGRNEAEPAGSPNSGRVDKSNDAERQSSGISTALQEGDTAFQRKYKPASTRAKSLETLVPSNMSDATRSALQSIGEDVDKFVASHLNYKIDELSTYFSAEQVDAIALGIKEYLRGGALILGDQTGIGKGRVVAGLIRFAMMQGQIPVFVTEKVDLYGDMFRDMKDIGLPTMLGRDVGIFATNAGAVVPLDDEAVDWKGEAEEADKKGIKPPPRRGTFLRAGSKESVERIMHEASQDAIPGYDVVFTTYDQTNTVAGKEPFRRSFLTKIMPNAFLILDESHNAGGGQAGGWEVKNKIDNRAEFLRKLVDKAKGIMYSSATYAKRPDVMDLYRRTDMSKAVEDISKLGELIQEGGVPMQQVVASMLAKNGQYIRRERSFEGIEYALQEIEVDREAYDSFSDALRAIQWFDLNSKTAMAEAIRIELAKRGESVSKDPGTGSAGASTTAFASVMHNLVGQMILSIKSAGTVKAVIASLKNDEKPVIALASTMESFIDDFVEENNISIGQPVDINFKQTLVRYLKRSLRVTVKRHDKTKYHIQIPITALPGHLQKLYADAETAIEESKIGTLPISPIDYLRNEITKAGYKVKEITGRQRILDYSGDVPILKARDKAETGPAGKRVTVKSFNDGKTDVLIFNRSGATGISMHASSKFKDQRKRRLFLQQAEGNIDTHMQTLGRVNRTGQVVKPAYSQLAANIPAEARPAALILKKMASLNANTTASRKGALSDDRIIDFMNQYGDQVMLEIMIDRHDFHSAMNSPLLTSEGKMSPENAAAKVTGRLTLLKLAEQEELLDLIATNYKALIEQLDATGENMLEAKSLDLQARKLDTKELKPRTGPSVFEDGVYSEWSSIKSEGKAMGGTALVEQLAELAGEANVTEGNRLERWGDISAKLAEGHQAKLRDLAVTVRSYNAASIDALKDIDAQTRERERQNANTIRFKETYNILIPGNAVGVVGKSGTQQVGVVLTVERTGHGKNPIGLSSWQVKVALPSSARTLTIPMSQILPPGMQRPEEYKGVQITEAFDAGSRGARLEEFDVASKSGREDRWIITGNLLAAYDQTNGKGQIINYTTDEGTSKHGILMPKEWDYDDFVKSRPVDLGTSAQVMEFLDKSEEKAAMSRDGIIDLTSTPWGYQVDIAAGRAIGGKYFLFPAVREATNDRLTKAGDKVRWQTRERGEFEKLVDALMQAGAKFETRTEQELAQGIVNPSKSEPAAFREDGEEQALPNFTPTKDFKSDPVSNIGERARGYVMLHGRERGVEFIVAIGPNGEVISQGKGTKNSIGISARLADLMMIAKSRIIVHHNHPSSQSLSSPDLKYLVARGLEAVWAHGHDGASFRANMAAPVKEYFDGLPVQEALSLFTHIEYRASQFFLNRMTRLVNDKILSVEDARALDRHLINTALNNAGIIDYSTTRDYSKVGVAAKEAIEKIARDAETMLANVKREILDGHLKALRNDRPARPIRHAGELEVTPQGGGEVASERLGTERTDQGREKDDIGQTEGSQPEGGIKTKGPIAPSVSSSAFKRWFGDSKVVDAEGKPLVVYHGTNDTTVFDSFTPQKGEAIWFSDAENASSYSVDEWKSETFLGNQSQVIPVYLAIKNPLVIDAGGAMWHSVKHDGKTGINSIALLAKERGHDGLIVKNVVDRGSHKDAAAKKTATSYAVFSPIQIKSTFNSGAYDPANPAILGSKGLNPNRVRYVTEAQKQKVKAALDRLSVHILGHRVELDVVDEIEGSPDFQGGYAMGQSKIAIALGLAEKPVGVHVHEIIHYMREKGLITKPEWAFIARWAKRQAALGPTSAYYTPYYRDNFDASPQEVQDKVLEEVFAFAVDDVVEGKRLSDDPTGHIERIIKKLLDFLEATRNLISGGGFQTVESLIDDMLAGKRAGRKPDPAAATRPFNWRPDHPNAQPLAPAIRMPKSRPNIPRSFVEPEDDYRVIMQSNLPILTKMAQSTAAVTLGIRRDLQDTMLDMARIEAAATAQTGQPLNNALRVYQTETLYAGRSGERMEDFKLDEIEPMAIEMKRLGLTMAQLDDFLYARHAPERNAYIASINPQFPDGGSGMTDIEARQIMADLARSGKLQAAQQVAQRIDRMRVKTLDQLLRGQVIDQHEYNSLLNFYQHYVPLRGDPNDDGSGAVSSGRKFDTRAKVAQQALGRRSRADSPTAYTIAQAQQAIILAEKARVGRSFLRFARRFPNRNLYEVEQIVTKRYLNPVTGMVQTRPDNLLKVRAENVLAVREGGNLYWITIHHQGLAKGLKGSDAASMHVVIRLMINLQRRYALMRTGYDPQFFIPNFLRDAQTAGLHITADQGAAIMAQVMKNIPLAMKGIYQSERSNRGANNQSNWAQIYKEFSLAGGKVGVFGLEDVDAIKANLDRSIKMLGHGPLITPYKAARAVSNYLLTINSSVENAVRVSLYKAMRDAGYSQDEAAYAAKEVTVNFNRKGHSSKWANAFYVFFTAGVQGPARVAKGLYRSKFLRRAVIGLFLSGLVMDLINSMVSGDSDDDGEDDYDQIDEWIKERNFIFMLPGEHEQAKGGYLHPPMPWVYNVFHYAGVNVGRMIRGKIKPLEAAVNVGSALLQSGNPLQSFDLASALSPTFLDPLFELKADMDWKGDPIMPEDRDGATPTPDSTKYFQSVNPAFKEAARVMNSWSGGDEIRPGAVDVSPESLEYIGEFIGGGVMATFNQVLVTAGKVWSGEELDWERVPFVRKVYGTHSTTQGRTEYYTMRDAVNITADQLEKSLREGDDATVKHILNEYKGDMAIISVPKVKDGKPIKVTTAFAETDKIISELKKQRNAVKLDTQRQAIQEQMDKVMASMRKAYRKAQGKQ